MQKDTLQPVWHIRVMLNQEYHDVSFNTIGENSYREQENVLGGNTKDLRVTLQNNENSELMQ
jgi:hypothetical protein